MSCSPRTSTCLVGNSVSDFKDLKNLPDVEVGVVAVFAAGPGTIEQPCHPKTHTRTTKEHKYSPPPSFVTDLCQEILQSLLICGLI